MDSSHTSPDGANNRVPFYRGAYQAQMAREENEDHASTGNPRYIPPHLRGEENDIVRPESSMSNVTSNTFATQMPNGNYAYGPSHLSQSMASYNPFSSTSGPLPQRGLPPRPNMGDGHMRSSAADFGRVSGYPSGAGHAPSGYRGPAATSHSRMNSVSNPVPYGHASSGYLTGRSGAATSGYQGLGWRSSAAAPPPPTSNSNTIAQPTPLRRDSGANNQTRAEYLASRVKQGHADNPFDPDYGNPGPSRAPPPMPKPIPFPSHKSPSDNPLLPKIDGKKVPENNDGNCKAFLGSNKVELPPWFAAATDGDTPPTIQQAFQNLPFIEGCRYAVPSTAGVVKVLGIPYSTTRTEVNAFLGKNIKICYQPAGTGYQAVHIIMDRHSGKTMDAFIEVITHHEAIWVVNQFQKRLLEKRPPKINGRIVEVGLSSQDELMQHIFPRAKQTTWENGVPIVEPSKEEFYPGVWSEGFKGFLQRDEIFHMYQHSEKPQRSPFVTRMMIRHYEYIITTLYKYPWFALDHVYLDERDALYEAVHASLRALIDLLRRIHNDQPDPTKPSVNTLAEYVTAIFVCPGFTDAQKNAVVRTVDQHGFGKYTDSRALDLRFGGVGMLAKDVPFQALILQPGVDEQVVEYFANLFADATTGAKPLSLADIHAMNASNGRHEVKKFGDLNIDYAGCRSIADAGRAELRYIEQILSGVLPSRVNGSSAGTPSDRGTSSRVSSLQLSR